MGISTEHGASSELCVVEEVVLVVADVTVCILVLSS
jgi:hypothetical protein